MEFTISQKDLINPLSLTMDLESKINPSATAAMFSFNSETNSLKLSCSDNENSYWKNIPALGTEDCEFWVIPRQLYSFVHAGIFLGKDIMIKPLVVGDKINQIKAVVADYEITIPAVNPENVVDIKETEIKGSLMIDNNQLKEALNKTKVCILDQKIRRNLGGLNFRKYENEWYFVGSDSFRISILHEQLAEEEKFEEGQVTDLIIPRKAVMEMVKILDDLDKDQQIGIKFDSQCFIITTPDCYYKTALIADEYPDITKFFNHPSTSKLEVEQSAILEALQIFKNSTEASKGQIRLDIDSDSVKLSFSAEEISLKKEVSGSYDSEKITISFNVIYLLEAIQSFMGAEENKLFFEFNGTEGPTKITNPSLQKYSHIVMPLRTV